MADFIIFEDNSVFEPHVKKVDKGNIGISNKELALANVMPGTSRNCEVNNLGYISSAEKHRMNRNAATVHPHIVEIKSEVGGEELRMDRNEATAHYQFVEIKSEVENREPIMDRNAATVIRHVVEIKSEVEHEGNEHQLLGSTYSPPRKRKLSNKLQWTEIHHIVEVKSEVENVGEKEQHLLGSTYSTPRQRSLSDKLRWAENKVKIQSLKIKCLQTQNRRLKKKLVNAEKN